LPYSIHSGGSLYRSIENQGAPRTREQPAPPVDAYLRFEACQFVAA
jgi:hypothetical protein